MLDWEMLKSNIYVMHALVIDGQESNTKKILEQTENSVWPSKQFQQLFKKINPLFIR